MEKKGNKKEKDKKIIRNKKEVKNIGNKKEKYMKKRGKGTKLVISFMQYIYIYYKDSHKKRKQLNLL